MAYIRRVAPDVPVILDAKRGDIGSTAEQYAREAFVRYQADAVTLSPFMGFDSIEPYLAYDGRGLILLCRTSNPGGSDLQAQTLANRRSAVRAHRQARRRALEPERPARPGGRRDLPGRGRARARAGAHAAAADSGHRRAGRRRPCHGRGGLAARWADRRQLLARRALCRQRRGLRGGGARSGARHARPAGRGARGRRLQAAQRRRRSTRRRDGPAAPARRRASRRACRGASVHRAGLCGGRRAVLYAAWRRLLSRRAGVLVVGGLRVRWPAWLLLYGAAGRFGTVALLPCWSSAPRRARRWSPARAVAVGHRRAFAAAWPSAPAGLHARGAASACAARLLLAGGARRCWLLALAAGRSRGCALSVAGRRAARWRCRALITHVAAVAGRRGDRPGDCARRSSARARARRSARAALRRPACCGGRLVLGDGRRVPLHARVGTCRWRLGPAGRAPAGQDALGDRGLRARCAGHGRAPRRPRVAPALRRPAVAAQRRARPCRTGIPSAAGRASMRAACSSATGASAATSRPKSRPSWRAWPPRRATASCSRARLRRWCCTATPACSTPTTPRWPCSASPTRPRWSAAACSTSTTTADGSRQLAAERALALRDLPVGEAMPARQFVLRAARGRRVVVAGHQREGRNRRRPGRSCRSTTTTPSACAPRPRARAPRR